MMTSPFQLVQFLAGPTLAMRSARSMGSLEATSMITASKNGWNQNHRGKHGFNVG